MVRGILTRFGVHLMRMTRMLALSQSTGLSGQVPDSSCISHAKRDTQCMHSTAGARLKQDTPYTPFAEAPKNHALCPPCLQLLRSCTTGIIRFHQSWSSCADANHSAAGKGMPENSLDPDIDSSDACSATLSNRVLCTVGLIDRIPR